MERFADEEKQYCTVLCPACGLVWTMDRLSPGPCPECEETHVLFRGNVYLVQPASSLPQALAT